MERLVKKAMVIFWGIVLLVFFLAYIWGGFEVMKTPYLWLNRILDVVHLLIRINVFWIAIVIFLENDNPSRTIAWLTVLILLPLLGFVMYILFGRSYHRKRQAKKKGLKDSTRMEKAAEIQLNLSDYLVLPVDDKSQHKRLMQLLLKSAKSPFSLMNEVKVYNSGEEKFFHLKELLLSAKHHIHMEYFIFKPDQIGNEIADILKKKSQEGVEVRVIYDDVGSWELSKSWLKNLKKSGVEILPFFKVAFPMISRELNYRNHRKIVVVDGCKGFVGGFNIGDAYIHGNRRFKHWRDTHLEIHGEAVYALQTLFLDDWNYISKENIDGAQYFQSVSLENESLIQIVGSGPDSRWKCIHQAFFKMVTASESRLWITSPYLVPDESLLMGLKASALSGVDVRLIIPAISDHFFVYWSSRANIESLLDAGVKIYEYTEGFVHSKIVISDRSCATVGTANFDIRSMEIDFEVNAFLYDPQIIDRLAADFLQDLNQCRQILKETHAQRPFYIKGLEALGRLVSPLQ